jgi:hypothetical protein
MTAKPLKGVLTHSVSVGSQLVKQHERDIGKAVRQIVATVIPVASKSIETINGIGCLRPKNALHS